MSRFNKKILFFVLKNGVITLIIGLGYYAANKLGDVHFAHGMAYTAFVLLFLALTTSDIQNFKETLEIELVMKLKEYIRG